MGRFDCASLGGSVGDGSAMEMGNGKRHKRAGEFEVVGAKELFFRIQTELIRGDLGVEVR
jgi:hypothetical protein